MRSTTTWVWRSCAADRPSARALTLNRLFPGRRSSSVSRTRAQPSPHSRVKMKTNLSWLSAHSLGIAALLMGLWATTTQAQGVAQCAQIPCDDVRTVAAASTGVPVEHDFDATAGTTYYVTLTDLGAQFSVPQPLATLKMAITANDALVNVTPIVGSGTVAPTVQL